MSEPTESPIPHDAHALLVKASGILRVYLTQEERERLARLLVPALWQKDLKPEPSATAIL